MGAATGRVSGAAVRDAAGTGAGGRRIFWSAAAYIEATTPHWAHLSFSTAVAPQRGHAAAISLQAPTPSR
jgi:hypothetical protein